MALHARETTEAVSVLADDLERNRLTLTDVD
jgi:hypothetical protein